MNHLVEVKDIEHAREVVSRLEAPGTPYESTYVEALHAIGRRILGTGTREPALVAAGYWLRKANLESELKRAGRWDVVAPRGLVFHVAPANVETMFLYSWAASFLAGNSSIVRLSRTRTQVSEAIIGAVQAELGERSLEKAVAFVSYDSDRHELTEEFSRYADVRMIWGGDQTIRRVRAAPTPMVSKDLLFADKVSAALIDGPAYERATSVERERLVQDFTADAWTFWQKACSSPHRLFWHGEIAASRRSEFWKAVESQARERVGSEPQMLAMNRLVESVEAVMDGADASIPHYLAVVRSNLDEHRDLHPGGGFFVETQVGCLDELSSILSSRTQTVAYWGFQREALHELRVDRVVPIGTALQFGLRWDGYDLLHELVRHRELR